MLKEEELPIVLEELDLETVGTPFSIDLDIDDDGRFVMTFLRLNRSDNFIPVKEFVIDNIYDVRRARIYIKNTIRFYRESLHE